MAEREAGETKTRLTRLLSSLGDELPAKSDRAASGEEPVDRFVVKSGGRTPPNIFYEAAGVARCFFGDVRRK